MALIVMIFAVTLVSHCCSAPQRRNWTPQAILYLKGAQRHRSVLERNTREEGDTLLVTHNQNSDGPVMSLSSSFLLELLQQAVEEDGDDPGLYPDEQEVILTYL